MSWFKKSNADAFNATAQIDLAQAYAMQLDGAIESLEKKGVKANGEALHAAISTGYPDLVERAIKGGAKVEEEHFLAALKEKDSVSTPAVLKALAKGGTGLTQKVRTEASRSNNPQVLAALPAPKPARSVEAPEFAPAL